jgi:hypothetical protein
VTGLPSDTGSTAAWVALVDSLADSAAAGRVAPCLVDPEPFTSESQDERAEAAVACASCPALLACARFAVAADEADWVWAGVDLTATGKPARRKAHARTSRARLVEVATCE